MTLGLYISALYTFGSMLSLIRKENLSALITFGLPFMAEALIIITKIMPEADKIDVPMVVRSEGVIENDLNERLLPKEEKPVENKDQVKSTNIFGLIEWWFYEAIDERFMPEFCNESLKLGVFSLPASKHSTRQILTVTFILIELFSAIMSAATTHIAPIMSILVCIYSVLSLYCFFDLPSSKLMKMSQSYFAGFKLSAFCLGYLFDAAATNQGFEMYFTMMTLLITADAYLSYN
jgi:hypothetical protein